MNRISKIVLAGIALIVVQSYFNVSQVAAKKIPTGISVLLDGDFADPTILKDGDDYYMTTSQGGFPSLMIWHSRDLLHWSRMDYALKTPVEGDVWAPDLIKHGDLFYIYFPAGGLIYGMTAKHPTGPWSEPKVLEGLHGIDPGHLVDKEGIRYLYIDNGRVAQLNADGLSMAGEETKVYDGWKFSDEYGVECFCLESPKMLAHGNYYYMVSAQGGTGGPSTSHMASVARSESAFGPFEDSPYNPLIKTASPFETWRSKGHATVFEGPGGKWYAVYHAYENGHLPQGRKTLLEPVEWTKDGWIKSVLKNPEKAKTYYFTENVRPVNDDFSGTELNKQWSFTDYDAYKSARLDNGTLILNCAPDKSGGLIFPICDKNFEVEFKIIPDKDVEAACVLYYNEDFHAGMTLKDDIMGGIQKQCQPFGDLRRLNGACYFKLRIQNYNLYIHYSDDGHSWKAYPDAFDISGYHANILNNFGSLKVAVIGKGTGKIVVDDFKYRVL